MAGQPLIASWPVARFNPILISTGSEVSATTRARKHPQRQVCGGGRLSIGWPIRSQATSALWVARNGRVGRRPEKCARNRAARDSDTDWRLNSAGMRWPGSFFGIGIGILIPNPVVYRLAPSRRINVFGSNLACSEAVEVRGAKRACTFNGQFFGRGGARAALHNHGLATCGGNRADARCRNRRHERIHFLVNRCDGCHSRYEHADRLSNRDEHSWSPGCCIIKAGALDVGSAPRALMARA